MTNKFCYELDYVQNCFNSNDLSYYGFRNCDSIIFSEVQIFFEFLILRTVICKVNILILENNFKTSGA